MRPRVSHTCLSCDSQLSLPDEEARAHILRVHSRKTSLEDADDTISKVAAASAGMSGAELANLMNEAAIGAVREGHAQVRLSVCNQYVISV